MDSGLSVRGGGTFRSIVERSAMTNNDEWVSYADSPMSPGDAAPHRLVISRPVYGFEVDAGLAMEDGSLFGRDEPDATLLADAMWRVKTAFDGYARVGMFGGDTAKAITHEIAYGYYDCMSGGISAYVVSILRYACEEFGVPGDTRVYPGGGTDGWHTISDFLKETEGTPDIRKVMGEGVKSLPSLLP